MLLRLLASKLPGASLKAAGEEPLPASGVGAGAAAMVSVGAGVEVGVEGVVLVEKVFSKIEEVISLKPF